MSSSLQPFAHSVYEPDAVRLMSETFDAAWARVQSAFAREPRSVVEDARTLLAETIISRVKVGQIHPNLLRDEGIQAVRKVYSRLVI